MQLLANLNELNELLLKLPQQKIAKVISTILLCYIAYLLAQFTWLFFSEVQLDKPPTSTFVQTTQDKVLTIDTQPLQKLNLFGLYSEQVKVEVVEVQDAPETSLRLTLTGTVASDDPSIAAAIIENNGQQETYGVGDKITGTRATLNNVSTDRVLIKQSGRLETLMLDGFKYKQRGASATRTTSKLKPATNRIAQAKYDSPKVLDQRNNKELSQSAALLKRDINTDPGKITEYLRIAPKRQGGKVVGYRLMPGKKADFFKSSGLKSGDVAVQMNGLDLTLPSEAAQALKALKEQQELSLLIDRNGEMTEILFSINN